MRYLAILALLLPLVGCAQTADGEPVAAPLPAPTPAPAPAPPSGGLTGTVVETFNGGGYTYLRLDYGGREIWAAVVETAVAEGSEVTIGGAMLMEDFESPSLGRTFKEIYFGSLESGAAMPEADPHAAPASADAAPAPEATANAEVEKADADNGHTVAEIYAAKTDLSGQKISVRGKVVKYNGGIMGRNWIHLQDGSGDAAAGTNDLTVTTADTVGVGDVVLIEGTLVLDKDFGAGYSYAVIVEDATVAP